MEESTFSLNNKIYSNNNNILFDIVNKLQYVLNDLNSNKNHSIIIQQIKNIMIIMNKVIIDNKNNMIVIQKDINKMFNELKEIKNDISTNNKINKNKIYNNSNYINENTKIKYDNDLLKNENNRINGKLAQLRSSIQILYEENRILREKNESNPSEIKIYEITNLRKENEELRKQLVQFSNLQNTFEQYKKLKEEEISSLNLKIQELVISKKKLDEFILQSQKKIEDLQNKDNRLEIIKGDLIKSLEELKFLTRKICKNHKKITLDLIYKATIDGDNAETFHNKCDFANSTLVLVKSGNNKRFGGFTTCAWKGNYIDKKDENAFIFSLDKKKIYDIIPGEYAIGCYPKYGPVFLGCQIRIFDDFFKKGGTTFEKGLNYKTKEDFELTGGLNKFEVKEIEVYSAEFE